MAINPKYVVAPSLEMYFVNKITGLPLAAGLVKFFKDNNRSVPKVAYTISGSPPNYTYNPLPVESTLSSIGTFQDAGGNNVLPYYYPYDEDGNIELYYIEVYDSNGILQFTREAWPNAASAVPEDQTTDMFNFVPNGQFLAHNNIPEDVVNGIPAGQIRTSSTNIAEGGWYFYRPEFSTSIDNISFFRFGEYVSNPTGSPRYACKIVCSSPDVSDSFKVLQIIFNDVNKFASNTQQYTFSFTAVTSESPDFNVQLLLGKNFGTGGSPSPPITTLLDTFTITGTETIFQSSFVFGTNESYILGDDNNDYVTLELSFPTNVSFGLMITDFTLFIGDITVNSFPPTTDRDFMSRTMVPPPPNSNGFDLYLPMMQTKDGVSYDDSQVGMVFPLVTDVVPVSYLSCDGAISYRTAAYSPEGIPYARLQRKLVAVTDTNPALIAYGMPLFGTGPQFVNSIIFTAQANWFWFNTNQPLLQASTADGVVSTGFQFFDTKLGVNQPAYGFFCYQYSSTFSKIWAACSSVGQVTGDIGPGTSGFDINEVPNSSIGERAGTTVAQQIINITVTAPPAASTYFLISNPTTSYYIWFTVDGTGTDPAPGGVGIQVNLRSTMNTADIAGIIANALNGFQITSVNINKNGSTLTPNSYFTFYSNNEKYYAWYNLNQTGIDPNVPLSIGIEVNYLASYSNQELRDATIRAMNSMYFATPDLKGVVIKGWQPNTTMGSDANRAYRYSSNYYSLPAFIGTSEFDMILSHTHHVLKYTLIPPIDGRQITEGNANWEDPINPIVYLDDQNIIQTTGASGNDVRNIYLNYVIKY